jgi:hypothetical protein
VFNEAILLQGSPTCWFSRKFGSENVDQFGSQTWIDINTITDYFQRNLPESSGRCRISQQLRGFKEGTQRSVSKEWVPASSLMRYIFRPNADIVSSTLSCDIESTLSANNRHEDSVFEIYQTVVQMGFMGAKIEDIMSTAEVVFDAPTLYDIHKPCFSETAWRKICQFEQHYEKLYGIETKDRDTDVKTRREFLDILLKTEDVCKALKQNNRHVIQNRTKRRAAANREDSMKVEGEWVHLLQLLDATLYTELNNSFPDYVNNVLVIPCDEHNQVTAYIECTDACLQSHITCLIGKSIKSHLHRKHHLVCKSVLYLRESTFKAYETDNTIGRFAIRDDVVRQKLRKLTICHWENDTTEVNMEDESQSHAENKCPSCYSQQHIQPLSFDSFDLFQEWKVDVPLVLQMLLQSFLNITAAKNASDPTVYLKRRIEKLYSLYDMLLNVTSQKHQGIFQQIGTHELMMNSKCLSTLFKVTSSVGATMSLSSGEKQLKERTVGERLHYKTFQEPHLLTYTTDAGEVTKSVNLRQCYNILMMDNLVRMKFHADPLPGDCRSKELDMLPITIQGLPADSYEINAWHNTTCDGGMPCTCMSPTIITKDELIPLLTTLLPDEEDALIRFQRLCTWGRTNIGKYIVEGM